MANHPSIVAAKKIKVFVNNKDLPFSNMGRSLKKKKKQKRHKVSLCLCPHGHTRRQQEECSHQGLDWLGP